MTYLTNFTGRPSLTVPAGMAGRFSIGIQLIGRRGADIALLNAGHAVERHRTLVHRSAPTLTNSRAGLPAWRPGRKWMTAGTPTVCFSASTVSLFHTPRSRTAEIGAVFAHVEGCLGWPAMAAWRGRGQVLLFPSVLVRRLANPLARLLLLVVGQLRGVPGEHGLRIVR
ncbi:hypothetical protein [Dactylosporangium salmoneum]|uniref:Amidase domain-containing protein n=1 Tax=Dactylosporangium salmoneum TaxID=53361 RepID=A0ABP5SZA2_9ACTN